jgi:plasmid stabilization system protein ParE
MARVVWSFRALRELEHAVLYIERNAPIAAKRFLKQVFRRASALADSPELGGFLAEDSSRTYRQLIHGNYRIIYRRMGSTVRIAAFMHAARLLKVEELN